MSRPTVVVITARFDPTADRAVTALHERDAAVFRFDLAEFPQALQVSGYFDGHRWSGRLSTPTRTLDLDDVTGIYYRRPNDFGLPTGMSAVERRWAASEARLGFGGLLAACPNWLNHPHRIAAADHKPLQLRYAAEAGLSVPHTLVTNDPRTAAGFAAEAGPVACKPFGPNGVEEGQSYRIAYTRRLAAEQLTDGSIAATTHQLQEWVDAVHAVRLTAVDDRVFAAAIHASSDAARIDWRSDYAALTYEPVDVPADVAKGVAELMRQLGLRFGVCDFLVTAEGRWCFLEIGANAQWAWIEHLAEPIAGAIAEALMEGAPDVPR